MSNTVIRAANLGKRYLISHEKKERYLTLRDALTKGACKLKDVVLQPNSRSPQSKEDFWAIDDISFEIEQGDRVGIIGRNGAGKSTLLKILSRITEPTTGYVELKGRVASLLEVGTGFHPELTGKENIFLNGAILGMGKAEISRKFDEIVAFAGVARFLSTPVKHYSSGMYVRLAFAVAAHLEPEILIVDEVLAVGDAQFQKKCLGKLEEAGQEGKTVLFVSHQMAAVEKLCRKGILLNQGKIQYIGSQTKAISKYLTADTNTTVSLESRKDRIGSGEVRIYSIDVKDGEGNILDVSQSGQDISINLHFKKIPGFRSEHLIASISVKNQLEVPVFLQHNRLTGDDFGHLPETGVLVCQINNLPLPPSSYRISYSLIQDGAYLDSISDATDLAVVDGDFYGSGEVPPATHGVCLIDASWYIKS